MSKLRLVVPVPELYVGTVNRGSRVGFKVAAFSSGRSKGGRGSARRKSMIVDLYVDNADRVVVRGNEEIRPGSKITAKPPLASSGTYST